jgi:outer membrane protein assembly factor BamB
MRFLTRLLTIGAVTTFLLALSAMAAAPNDWPQWRGPNRDGVWNDPGIVKKFAEPQLKLRWRAPVSNGYSGPTVAGGKVYLTDRVTEPKSQERVHCFDWQTGRPLWTHAYDAPYGGVGYPNGPRASVTIDDGRAYAIGAVGQLVCLDAAKGAVIWSKSLDAEYDLRLPVWGVSAAPLVTEGLVIVHIGGDKGACLVAFDKKTGEERWRALDDRPSYSPPILVEQAGKKVLVCWTGDRVVGLDPSAGKLYWEYPFPARQVVIAIATPIVRNDLLFVTSFYEGSLMLRLKQDSLAVEKVWQRRGQNERSTDGLHSIISTAMFQGDYLYGVDSYGELRCLDGKTGDRLWESQAAVPRARWANIHFVKHGEDVWMFNERGQLLISKLSPKGFEEISRTQLIQPTLGQLPERGGVCWAHPAFAYGHVFARNDEELVCADLTAKP